MNASTWRIPSLGLVLLLLAFPMVAQEPTPAEGTDGEADVAVVDETAALFAKIKAADTELLEITREIEEAQGEALVLLRTRFSEVGSQQRVDLMALVKHLQDQREARADVTLLQQQIEQLLSRSSRRLRSYIQSFEEDLENEGVKRDALSAAEVEEFEHRMAVDTDRLDHLYLSLIELTDLMAGEGVAVDEERLFLETRLAKRSEDLLRILQLTQRQLEADRELLKRAPSDGDLQVRVFAAEERYDSNKTALLATIHMMSVLGLDYVDLEVRTLALTREITPEALEIDVAVGWLEQQVSDLRQYLREEGPGIILRAVVILAILVISWILARVVRNLTRRALDRTKISTSKLLKEMAVRWAGRIVLIIGFVIILSQLGINLGPVLAGFGIAGIVIGFALQDTLSNFAAGAMILAYRPFDVGDLVETVGVQGRVSDMNLVSTRILTVDHQTLVVPNSKIWGDVIRNVTAQTTRRVDMVFGISYEDEIPKAERVLEEIVDRHDKVLDDPKPVIKLHTLNDSSVDFIVRPWARTDDYWDVYWDITREVKIRFDQEGISIPFPQRDVHLFGQDSEETG